MIKELKQGFKDSGKILEKLTADATPAAAAQTEVKEGFHFRLSWVLYLTADFEIVPARASVFSKYHTSDQRIPEIFATVLAPYRQNLEGVFPEPLSATEDLGYLVFTDQVTAVAVAGQLSNELEAQFGKGIAQTGFMYGELELAECCGSYTAPAMTVKREVLLNPGFDGARQAEEIITLPDELIF